MNSRTCFVVALVVVLACVFTAQRARAGPPPQRTPPYPSFGQPINYMLKRLERMGLTKKRVTVTTGRPRYSVRAPMEWLRSYDASVKRMRAESPYWLRVLMEILTEAIAEAVLNELW